MTGKHGQATTSGPNASMKMSPEARARMRATEKAIYRYYNDLGKNKGNCTWGAGILSHKGVCTEDELKKKVSATMVDQEFERRVGEAERIVQRNTIKAVNQDQFDALVSLTYNSGGRGARDTFDFVNRGDLAGAAKNISSMIKVGVMEKGKKKYVVAPGLIKRREEEAAPFRVKDDKKNADSK
ncbi:glycoside hydrolase family protein [Massilia sp. Root335]|uniref:glycoside hydrolase family protein n=1 Tax=Massilia sp. Root335 TaxID=1736517 RepID=UPI001E61C2E1|nr:glycoside hydrolase family protein [Massilia sp. Root335]